MADLERLNSFLGVSLETTTARAHYSAHLVVNLMELGQDKSHPWEIVAVEDETQKKLLKDFDAERTGWVYVGPEKYCFQSPFVESAGHIYNMKVDPKDIWIVTFPRSGTTVTQEMTWLIANDMDFETAARIPLVQRSPFLEFNIFMHKETTAMFLNEAEGDPEKQDLVMKLATPGYEVLNKMAPPRFIKTHLPISLLPKDALQSKVIYVARNPKDVCASLYHLYRLMRTANYYGNFEKFWNYFQNGHLPWAPFWSHVNEGWRLRHHPNLLFLFYEDIVQDMPSAIRKVSKFLGKPVTEPQVRALANHLDINNFKNNPSVNFDVTRRAGLQREGEQGFIRKGKTGGNSEFSPELNAQAEAWIEQAYQHTDLRFPLKKPTLHSG